MSALGPSIAAAVEQALAAQAAQQSRLQAEAVTRAEAERRRFAASRTTTMEERSDPPKYNFEYLPTTNISKKGIRDGDELTGAGPLGYTKTRDEMLGYSQIRSEPVFFIKPFSFGRGPDSYSSCKNVARLTGECLQRAGEQDPDRYNTDDTDDFILELTRQFTAQAEAAARAQAEAAASSPNSKLIWPLLID